MPVTGPSEDTTGRQQFIPGQNFAVRVSPKSEKPRRKANFTIFVQPAIMPRKMFQKLDGTIRI
jgi:hypothetical protein